MTQSTSSTEGAQAHARSMDGTVVETMATIPASAAGEWPAEAQTAKKLWAETVAGGNYTALSVARGALIELTDIYGDANAHIVAYNATDTSERLNVADTVKVQWQAYLGEGQLLLSDRGRALATIVKDTSGKHDTFAGVSTLEGNRERYGDGTAYCATPAGRELLVLAAAKVGLEPRDIPPTVGLFKGYFVQPDGSLVATGDASAGAKVVLRTELPLVLLIANAPHPLDAREGYHSTPLQIRIWDGSHKEASPEIELGLEAKRALANTQAYVALKGI
jgi:urea carboxylase-associated protein 2